MYQQIKTLKNEHRINRLSWEHRQTTCNRVVRKRTFVTVISSNAERKTAIETLGAKAAIGSMFDADFLTSTFKGAEIRIAPEPTKAECSGWI